jgi:TorA maturation chaperone TorD
MNLDECLDPDPAANANLADLWLTLGRAFLPPMQPEQGDALRDDLPADLADWSRELGFPETYANRLLDALTAFSTNESLLVHYSGLFYAPPIRVHLNLGIHLDGALNGPTMDALGRWQDAYGLDRSTSFHDLTDHLSAVLELLSVIARQPDSPAATEFAHAFLIPTLPRIIARMEALGAAASPYVWLLRYTLAALEACYPLAPVESKPAKPRYRVRPVGDGWRRCGQCGAPIASEKEVMVMEKALAAAGLPADHLRLCPDCRAQEDGWEKRPLP